MEQDGHRIECKLSQHEAWELFSNIGGCLKQVARVQDHGIDNPVDHKNALVLPAGVAGVGTNSDGLAVIAVSSLVFPTVHIPLNEDQTQTIGTALAEIASLQGAKGDPH